MRLGDREFTSEEVASLCGVTRVTVADWIERGRLRVRWTAGGHRRIPRESLAEFMSAQGYQVPRVVGTQRVYVLVIDDEAEWRTQLRSELSTTGDFDVEALAPGVDALLALGEKRPDVLVIDSCMPGFDSRHLVEVVRSAPELSQVTIVMLTSFDEETSSAKRYGADLAVSKRRSAEISTLLVRLLRERQRRAAPDEGQLADRTWSVAGAGKG